MVFGKDFVLVCVMVSMTAVMKVLSTDQWLVASTAGCLAAWSVASSDNRKATWSVAR